MNNDCKWLQETKDGVVLTVKAVPRAAKSEIAGVDDEWLRVRVKAPPVDGKANEALVKFFAEFFTVPKGSVSLVSGDTARLKRIKITGMTAEKAKTAFSAVTP
jgi:uncharacterized protein (TIGR00251 family)